MNNSKIQIREAFNAQYSLLIEMESMLVNATMKSKTEIRYDFAVQQISDDGFECRLLQLDIFIHDTNNSLVHEVAELTGAFNRMFSELKLKMSHSGIVLEVLNLELILSKWAQTKKLMQQACDKNPDLKELISVSDNLFTSHEKIQQAIQANEFIQTYFGNVFDTQIPFGKQNDNRTNYFNTAYLPFKITAAINEENSNGVLKVETKCVPAVVLDKDFKKNAYKSFEDKIDINTLKPSIEENATYFIQAKSGKLVTAEVLKQEFVENRLFTKMSYKMNLEEGQLKTPEPTSIITHQDNEQSRFKFF